jgi:hypothetical protein
VQPDVVVEEEEEGSVGRSGCDARALVCDLLALPTRQPCDGDTRTTAQRGCVVAELQRARVLCERQLPAQTEKRETHGRVALRLHGVHEAQLARVVAAQLGAQIAQLALVAGASERKHNCQGRLAAAVVAVLRSRAPARRYEPRCADAEQQDAALVRVKPVSLARDYDRGERARLPDDEHRRIHAAIA